MTSRTVSSGLVFLDEIIRGLRLGDNVVLQVDDLDDYVYFARAFAQRAMSEDRHLVYLRFAPHEPVLAPREYTEKVELDPSRGFDAFSTTCHQLIDAQGPEVFYVFDSLSELVERWATEELLANFFRITCPFLFELDTVAYFALTRGRHNHRTVARIRDTTQVLLDVYRVEGELYVHPLKVWDRYSPEMFLPHMVTSDGSVALLHSHRAAAVSSRSRRPPIRGAAGNVAPWDSVFVKLGEYREAGGDTQPENVEAAALKSEMIRMLLGTHPRFNRMADRYFTIDDLFEVRERLIGSGRIGGKAAGMLLARNILLRTEGRFQFSQILESHDSFYIGSDVFFTFLVNNNLFQRRLEICASPTFSQHDFDETESLFVAGNFPPEIVEQFREMLDHFGQAPIIVRSSSLLEDSFGNAFAGKYLSEFCANQGPPEERLEAFLKAVKRVYASALDPHALSYRRKRGLMSSDEQMAILVQRVSGTRYKHFFFPPLAGVAFSRNLYAWCDRIDPNQGVIRLVFGLGTRAVDRVGRDYPRMIAVSQPALRPETGRGISRYSQWDVDVLDLESNAYRSVAVRDLLADRDYPELDLLVSLNREGEVMDPLFKRLKGTDEPMVLTFNRLIQRTDFVEVIGEMTRQLENVYGHPVDVEFTAFVEPDERIRVNLLQCRPLMLPGATGGVAIPEGLPPERVLFRSSRCMTGGVLRDIRYVLYIDPRRYKAIDDIQVRKSLGRLVGRINEHPDVIEGKIIMLGPGRWGSANINLGINVGFADICNASVLAEVAREEAGHVPELSFGTHFFLDIVEGQIIYLPVYPHEASTQWNAEFLENSTNALSDLLPDAAEFGSIVRIIDVPSVGDGARVQVVADPLSRRAVCFLAGG